MNWVVLIVMLVGRLAHAGQERPAGAGIEAPSDEPLRPFPTNVAIAQPAPQMARIGAEILAGGIVEVGFGLIGASIGTEYDPPGALRWTETGLSLGALLGTSIGSVITGGTGNFRWASLGTAIGLLAANVLVLALPQNSNSTALALGAAVVLPLTGAIIGYEVTQRPTPQFSDRAPLHFFPTVSVTQDGHGATTGIAGFF